jgi:hypothetical protein
MSPCGLAEACGLKGEQALLSKITVSRMGNLHFKRLGGRQHDFLRVSHLAGVLRSARCRTRSFRRNALNTSLAISEGPFMPRDV